MKCGPSVVVCLILGASLFAQSDPAAGPKQETPSGTPTSEVPPRLIRICGPKNPLPCATPPRPVFTPDPEYSKEARDAHYQGTSVLWLIVGTDGRVHNLKVARAIGLGLDEKAMEAVRRWVFAPAAMDGKPVAVQINVEVSFRLSSLVVSPTSAQVTIGATQQFSATVPGATNSAVRWSVSGSGCAGSACGRISEDGLYTAPGSLPTPATVTVTATSATDAKNIASAIVNLQPSPPQ